MISEINSPRNCDVAVAAGVEAAELVVAEAEKIQHGGWNAQMSSGRKDRPGNAMRTERAELVIRRFATATHVDP